MAFMTERDSVIRIKSVLNIPMEAVEMMSRKVCCVRPTDLADELIPFHYGSYELSVFGVVVSIGLPHLFGNALVIGQPML